MRYALINDGIVTNIIWLHPDNVTDFPNAVEISDLLVGIGDTYEDGVFYHNGERVLTAAEQAQKESTEMKEALTFLGVTIDE